MKKYKISELVFRTACLFFILLFSCTSCDRILDALDILPKRAQWWNTSSSEESKLRGVFVAYYDALPFEYEDSIVHIKLVFSEVYTEWEHWYEWSDKEEEHCLYYNNSETIKSQHLIAVFDTSMSILGFARDEDSIRRIVDSLIAIGKSNIRYDNLYWYCPLGCYTLDYLLMERVKYDYWQKTGSSDYGFTTNIKPQECFGEFDDTIKIPIVSTYLYNKKIGLDNLQMELPFGEIVFVRRKQEPNTDSIATHQQ